MKHHRAIQRQPGSSIAITRALTVAAVMGTLLFPAMPGYADTQIGTDADNVTVNVDNDGDTNGAFIVSSGGATETPIIFETQLNQTTITSGSNSLVVSGTDGTTVTGGLDNSGDGITNAGAISGATTISASGLVSSGSLTTGAVSSTGINNSGTTTTGTLSVTNNATVGGTLGVTGNTSLSTVSTSGLATLNSASVANGLTVGGTSTLNGATAINNTLSVNSGGGATELSVGTDTVTMAGTTNINNNVNSATNINTGTSTGVVTIGNAQNTVGMLGETNTIGNAGSSANTMTGASNTVTATGANSISGATNSLSATTGANTITGQTGNTLTATTGGNDIIATTGRNTLSANAADQSNTLSATGTNGVNNLTANATSGTNNIEAYNNRIGVATANSINSIGNTSTGTTVTATGGNSYMSVSNGTASLRSGSGATASGLTSTSTANMLSNTSAALSAELNGTGDDASRQNIAGATYVNRLEGNTLINGNTYINGTLAFTSNTSANTTVTSGVSVLSDATQATNGQMSISNTGGTGATVDANGQISTGIVDQSTASLTLTNGLGNTHGLIVTESQTTMSGGTHSSSLTLADNGATFSNAQTGKPIRVHGVDDGTADFDAVNIRQMASGIAMAAGLAALPQVEPGKRFGLAAGTGIYMDKVSVAVGLSGRFFDSLVVKGGISMVPSYGQFNQVGNIGIGYSW